jgi:uncharacterized protein YwgA
MKITFAIPWPRYGLIADLTCRNYERANYFGKTALQKQVYLLQTLFGVDCGYDFGLHTYGPFSAQLLADLDALSFMGGVTVENDPSIGGYRILPGERCDYVRKEARDFLEASEESIVNVVEEFGPRYAKDLELLATTVYAEREALLNGTPPLEDELADVVSHLKPHFSKEFIREAIRDLRDRSHIATR